MLLFLKPHPNPKTAQYRNCHSIPRYERELYPGFCNLGPTGSAEGKLTIVEKRSESRLFTRNRRPGRIYSVYAVISAFYVSVDE